MTQHVTPPTTEPFESLVIIGASAGGISAVATVLASMPVDLNAPVVVAQHMDPARPSHLREILAARSRLPVETVEDHAILRPGVVYVVPPDRHVEVTDHALTLTPRRDGGPSPSVDTLLATAAQIFGERLIAVILTGMGSDGADGAWEVKEAGGTVIVQDPRTASYPEMPLALAPATVDMMSALEAIGPLVESLLTGTNAARTTEEDQQMRQLLNRLRQESGIDFAAYRPSTIQRRLRRRMLDTGADEIGDYVQYVRGHPEEYQRLASTFLIKVTHFFRDPQLFDHLSSVVVPDLIARARESGDELRMWSAGCATGEEAYSLAMLVAEALGDNLSDAKVRIFATDVDPDALVFARQGLYPTAALKQVSTARRERFFSPLEGGYEVRKHLRQMLVFGQHDLGQRSPFPRIDLVLCRNVLIYFAPELQRRALQLFAFALRPDGRLILGKSETAGPVSEYFSIEDLGLKVYRRQSNRILIPPTRPRDVTELTATPSRMKPAMADREARIVRSHQAAAAAPRFATESERRALADLPIGLAIVDREYDLRAINAAARRLLDIHTAAIGEDLIHLAHRLPSDQLRNAINDAFNGQSSVQRFEVPAVAPSPGVVTILEIGCYPHDGLESPAPGERVLVSVTNVTPPTAPHAAPETDLARQLADLAERMRGLNEGAEAGEILHEASSTLEDARERAEALGRVIGEFEAMRRELLDANQNLAAANEELQRQNEELMISQEEAEAAAEEIETLSEEQQATNEELETLNEELQATVEELNTTNDDLEARHRELQDLASALESERLTMGAAVLSGLDDPVLIVDAGSNPIQTNQAFDRLIGSGAFEALDKQGRPLPTEFSPRHRAARGESFQTECWLDGPDGVRRCFRVVGWPVSGRDTQGALRFQLAEE
jgi:two-component system CheB/CheR fusion protein